MTDPQSDKDDVALKTAAAVGEVVMGASVSNPNTRLRYSLGTLAAVMAKWIEQPHRGWLGRELAQATGAGPEVIRRVLKDLVAAGHAVATESTMVGGYRYRRGSYVLTAVGLKAWQRVDLQQVGRRYVAPHRQAKPPTPMV